jgi:hypothetical protein
MNIIARGRKHPTKIRDFIGIGAPSLSIYYWSVKIEIRNMNIPNEIINAKMIS